MTVIEYSEIDAVLGDASAQADASEAHGVLCGLLCSGWHETHQRLRDYLFPDDPDMATREDVAGTIGAMTSDIARALGEGQMEFMPLLPPDQDVLEHRVEALAHWCQGFIHGLGAGNLDPELPLPEEVQELIRDFGEIARAVLDDEDDEEGEAALVELVEYVRVGVQVIFDACASGHGAGRAPSPLH